MTAALVRAASEFLQDESKRVKRPRFSDEDRWELKTDLDILSGNVDFPKLAVSALRGEVALEVIGYSDTFDENATNVIADILHSVEANGFDPMTVMAHARAEFYRDKGQEAGDES